MAFQLPGLPNLQTNIPPPANPLDQASKAATLSTMLNENKLRQQLAPLNVQEAQQRVQQMTTQNQQAQLELQSQQAMMKAWSDPDFVKSITGTDAADASGHGFDPNAMMSTLAQKGVLPKDAQALVNSFVERSKNVAMMTKDQLSNYEKSHEALANGLAPILDMPVEKATTALDNYKQKLLKSPIPGLSQTDLALVNSADLQHLPAIINALELNSKIADWHKGQAAAAKEGTEAQKAAMELPGGALSPEAKAKSEAQARLDVESSPQAVQLAGKKAAIEANARQTAAQGDPKVAGKMLADGSLTLADLKTRGTTPQFLEQATIAAQKIDSKYNPADEMIAEHVAKSPTLNQFFGSANSLISKGGTLDQLEAQGKKIPNNKLPTLNTVDDWIKLKSGSGPLAGYAATALGVADDYGKVMGGGNASDHARDAALALFAAAQSPEQRAAAIQSTRDAVQSQRDSRIQGNQFLKRQYGSEVSKGAAAGAGMIRARDPQGVLHEAKEGTALPAGWKLEK